MFRHPDFDSNQGEFKDSNSDQEFNQSINQSIRYFKVPATREKSDVLNALLNEITELKIIRPEKNRARRLYIAIGSIASAACLLLFLYYFAFSYETHTYAQGGDNSYYLPDQSKVVLSPDSKISYTRMFFNRNVDLNGEGYFEVKKGSKFSVKTPNGEVRVLGTKFSVSDKDDGFIVCCFEGKVEVKYKKEERQLIAGNKFESVAKKSLPASEIENTLPAVVYFDQTFQNKSVKDIWPIIEKHFGVTIYYNIPNDRKYSGSFHSSNVNEVIRKICTTLDMSYTEISEKKFLIQNGNI